jgi:hypothetical protein
MYAATFSNVGINEDEMGRTCSAHVEMRNTKLSLESEGKAPIRRPRSASFCHLLDVGGVNIELTALKFPHSISLVIMSAN